MTPSITVAPIGSAADHAAAQDLMRGYVFRLERDHAITVAYQDFDGEMATFPDRYALVLLARVNGGEELASVASAESDAPSSRARGGAIGTFVRDEWPELFAPLKEPLFAAAVGARTPVVEAPFGWVFGERCAVEKVHTRHLLIRYTGARNAPEDLERSQDAARTLAAELRQAALDGRSFEELAREHSEDGSAERGGDLGSVGRGLFQPPYEEAAFALPVGGISDVVETVYGYHVIQRVQ